MASDKLIEITDCEVYSPMNTEAVRDRLQMAIDGFPLMPDGRMVEVREADIRYLLAADQLTVLPD